MKYSFWAAIPALCAAILSSPAAAPAATGQQPPTFRSDVRLIEVYVTVLDRDGRYVSGLTRDRFEILDNGIPCASLAFEATTSGFSCAILLDRTGSMGPVLPAVKSAILRFIDEFRANDVLALYSFNTALTSLMEFSSDKDAAKQAVLTTIAGGGHCLVRFALRSDPPALAAEGQESGDCFYRRRGQLELS